MEKAKKIVALIPLRGGSKSVPLKNIKPIAGKPLCYWTVTAALRCPEIEEVWVSTDHPQIKEYCLSLGAKVIDRPEQYATDQASTESVMLHFKSKVKFDVLVTLQATSPLTQPQQLSEAIKLFLNNNFDSLLTCVEIKKFFWSREGKAMNYDYLNRPRRQDFPGYLMENGAFYLTRRQTLEKFQNRLGGRIAFYQMPPETGVELDEELDWQILEAYLLKNRPKDYQQRIRKIRCIFSDFDGVFTDNLVWTQTDGNEAVVCSKADSLGLSTHLPMLGLPLTVISTEKNAVVEKRCQKLGLSTIASVHNKKTFLDTWLANNNFSWEEVAYFGNDLNDLECINAAGFSAAPNDAQSEIKKVANFVGESSGGQGFIREVLSLMYESRIDL